MLGLNLEKTIKSQNPIKHKITSAAFLDKPTLDFCGGCGLPQQRSQVDLSQMFDMSTEQTFHDTDVHFRNMTEVVPHVVTVNRGVVGFKKCRPAHD